MYLLIKLAYKAISISKDALHKFGAVSIVGLCSWIA
jgi:hypothetical protein